MQMQLQKCRVHVPALRITGWTEDQQSLAPKDIPVSRYGIEALGTEAAGFDYGIWISGAACDPMHALAKDDPVLTPISKRADAACKLAQAAEQMARAPAASGK